MRKLAEQEPSAAAPAALDREAIKEAPNLFQPRHDSIAFAPGRSEAHISELAQALRQSGELDPVTVIAFGDAWYLVDGHHRLAAYTAVEWARPIPVRPVHSDRRGDARIDWAIEQSMAENKKSKLNISTTDKADAAWQAVAQGRDKSKAHVKATYAVSDGSVAAMRRARSELEERGVPASTFTAWRTAQNELKRLKGDDAAAPSSDHWDAQRRNAAKRLKPVMDLRLSPDQLAEALEAYSPGIVEAMAASQRGDPLGLDEE